MRFMLSERPVHRSVSANVPSAVRCSHVPIVTAHALMICKWPCKVGGGGIRESQGRVAVADDLVSQELQGREWVALGVENLHAWPGDLCGLVAKRRSAPGSPVQKRQNQGRHSTRQRCSQVDHLAPQ